MKELQIVNIKLLQKKTSTSAIDNENLKPFYKDVSECLKGEAPLITR
jgi:hypothetical protein